MNSIAWVPHSWVTVNGVIISKRHVRQYGNEAQLATLIATTQIIMGLMTCN